MYMCVCVCVCVSAAYPYCFTCQNLCLLKKISSAHRKVNLVDIAGKGLSQSSHIVVLWPQNGRLDVHLPTGFVC